MRAMACTPAYHWAMATSTSAATASMVRCMGWQHLRTLLVASYDCFQCSSAICAPLQAIARCSLWCMVSGEAH